MYIYKHTHAKAPNCESSYLHHRCHCTYVNVYAYAVIIHMYMYLYIYIQLCTCICIFICIHGQLSFSAANVVRI